jgi:heat shock protein HslJ
VRGAALAVVGALVAVAAVAALAFGLVPGGPDDTVGAEPVASLAEVAGTWEALDASDAPAALVAPVVLQVAEPGIYVRIGCNTGRGPAHVDGSRLVVDAFATTRRACAPPVDAQEQWVLQMLDSAPRLERSGTSLSLVWGAEESYRLGFAPVEADSGDGPAPRV